MEMLELAAKACGLPEYGWMGPNFMYVKDNTFTNWNPLEDDGDALRLAMTLKLRIIPGMDIHPYRRVEVSRLLQEYAAFVPWGDDIMAAVRLAIVRCAANIGKEMP
jgi:hypothetical protein